MKYLFKTLLTNIHILVVSLLVAALGLGMLSRPSTTATSGSGAKKSHQVTELSTIPINGVSPRPKSSTISVSVNAASGSVGAQNETSQSVSTPTLSSTTPASPPASVSPPVNCTPCSTADGCTNSCTATNPTPSPPPSGCAVCGNTTPGTHPQHIMCPMYCMQMDPVSKAD